MTMQIGILWHDDDPKRTLEMKPTRAAHIFSLCEFCHRPEFIVWRQVGDHSQCFPF